MFASLGAATEGSFSVNNKANKYILILISDKIMKISHVCLWYSHVNPTWCYVVVPVVDDNEIPDDRPAVRDLSVLRELRAEETRRI